MAERAGTTYAFNKDASVDVGVSYMHGQHVEIKEGPYTFRSEGTAWLYGANFNSASDKQRAAKG